MRRGLDFDKAEAALRRAAEKAIHGPREERSGQFLSAKKPSVSPPRRAAKRSSTERRKD